MIPIILSGGSGTRLWPLSRAQFPKQFLALQSENTMLQETLKRLDGMELTAPPIVVCNDEHRFIVAEQLRHTMHDHATILLEPVGRNTAPAIAVAALKALEQEKDPILLVLPADHVIQDIAAFRASVAIAQEAVAEGHIVTFGIPPTSAETGYGYIKAIAGKPESPWRIEHFAEKPDQVTANSYLESGEYFWNSGMFMFRAAVYIEELNLHAPDILASCCEALNNSRTDLDFIRLDKAAFAACTEDSIDYAIMEKTERAMMVSMHAGWNDIGSWAALWDIGKKDEHGNVSKGDTLAVDTRNSYLHSSGRMLATLGLEDIIALETPDVVLVASRSHVQHIKKIVEKLRGEGRNEAFYHRIVHRPWGSYDSVDNGVRYQVKRITVNPGAKLSVQMHHHRAEHWIVVSGTAKVQIGNDEILLTENQSTYIPVGVVHALENPGKIPLELIEVQSGSYLGEDDIIRLNDRYGRA